MEAVLFIGHGSRVSKANKELLLFTKKVALQLDAPIIETCFLEWVSPNIPQGIDRCVRRGAKRIRLLPIMLFAAGHAKVDIPQAIAKAHQKYPHIQFDYGQPIGSDKGMLPILMNQLYLVQPYPSKQTAVLIVGRGSSDLDANSELYKIARMFWEKSAVQWVEVAYYGVTYPSFEEGIERCITLGAKEVIILPYLLFTGVIMRRMKEKLEIQKKKVPSISLQMCHYLGADDLLVDVFSNRLNQMELPNQVEPMKYPYFWQYALYQ
ncbi:sirohydrochlorin chelatase [Thermoflavimicrobium daqui]|uniref:sirohydrochlorin chelatase n=1 Tax=Thermoflavimicrobium daqui TaxID=2137476 RepID=UPI00143D8479|nr:sirohydrochlorin chelatase [Thermoflavimicrobium daqui]